MFCETIKFPRWWSCLVLLAALGVFVAGGAVAAVVVTSFGSECARVDVKDACLLAPVLAAYLFLCWCGVIILRYRESLFTTFTVSRSGVSIENSRYGCIDVSWHEFSCATYSKVGKHIVLHSEKLQKPIAIISDASKAGPGVFPEVLKTIRLKLSSKMTERYF